jgi:hypothetical protein
LALIASPKVTVRPVWFSIKIVRPAAALTLATNLTVPVPPLTANPDAHPPEVASAVA